MKNSIYLLLLAACLMMMACNPVICDSYTSNEAELRAKVAPVDSADYQFQTEETPTYILKSLELKRSVSEEIWSPEVLREGRVIGWYDHTEKATGKRTLQKAVLTEQKDALVLNLLDEQGKTLEQAAFKKATVPQDPGPVDPVPVDPCDTQGCWEYYAATVYPTLLAQANATCRNVYYCVACPVVNPCIYAMVVVTPTRRKCMLVPGRVFDRVMDALPTGIPLR